MASGSFSGGVDGNHYRLQLNWSSSQNGQNSSNVHVDTYFISDWSIYSYGNHSGSVNVNGSAYGFTIGNIAQESGSIYCGSWDTTVSHDSSGNASISISGNINPDATLSGTYYNNIHAEGTANLDHISHTAPGVPEWGPAVSPSSCLSGQTISAAWGGGGGMGDNASFDHCEVQWNYNNTSWGTVANVNGFNTTLTMPNIPGGFIWIRVRVWNNYGLTGGWTNYAQVNCLGATTINSVTGIAVDPASISLPADVNVYVSSYFHNIYLADISSPQASIISWSAIKLSNGANTLSISSEQREALLNHIPNAKSFSAYLYIDSYANASDAVNTTNRVGSRATSAAFDLTTSQDISSPQIFEFSYKDSNDITSRITGNDQWLIQNLSDLQVNIPAASAMNGASISEYSVSIANSTVSGTSPGTYNLGRISQTGTLSCALTVTDTRGYTGKQTVTVNVAGYSNISITTADSSCQRNGYGTKVTLEIYGIVSKLLINGVNKNAFCDIQYRYLPNVSITRPLTNITEGSTEAVISDTSGMAANESVSGDGIPKGTYISSITNATTMILSKAATATRTNGNVTIGNDWSDWIDETATSDANSFSLIDSGLSGDLGTNGFTALNSFTIQVRVTDTVLNAFSEDYSASFTLPQAIPLVTFENAKIGINNPNPTCAADICGDINIDGNLKVSGNIAGVAICNYTVGDVVAFSGDVTSIPSNGMLCDGREIGRTKYDELFSIIGTRYGAGDGAETFNIPNIKHRVIVMQDLDDANFNALGECAGSESVTLDISTIPPHKHQQTIGGIDDSNWTHVSGQNPPADGPGTYLTGSYTDETGGGQPHNNLQPYITLNYYIVFSRNVTNPGISGNADTVDSCHVNDNSVGDIHSIWTSDKVSRFVTASMGATDTGKIEFFPSTKAPNGYIKANGATLSRTLYSALWNFANSSNNIVSESVWQAGGHDGSFSTGDGSTTFRIPYINGYTLRAFDDGRGIDSSRAIGSSQQDQNKNHTHTASSGYCSNDHTHSGNTGNESAAHCHSQDSRTWVNMPGSVHTWYFSDSGGGFWMNCNSDCAAPTGTTAGENANHYHGFTTWGISANHNHAITVNASTDGGAEVRVKNVALLACIKY